VNTPRFAPAVAKLLGRSLPPPGSAPGDRARGILTIERALLARTRRRRLIGGLAACAAVAAAASLPLALRTLGGTRPVDSEISINVSPAGQGAAIRSGDRAIPLPQRTELASGQRIETPADGGASLRLSTGTSMDISGRTSFQVDSQGATERFSLLRGEVTAHVAKLAAGQRFIIVTPDAEVEVRGTRFTTRVLDDAQACGAGARTRLEVSEGLVEVRAGGRVTNVAAGQIWPPDCAPRATEGADAHRPLPAPAPAAASSSLSLNGQPGSESSHPHAPRHAGQSPAALSAPDAPDGATLLRQQNDLFAEAVALRRQGDVPGALRAQQELLTRFPDSPLAENALAERMRLLAAHGDARARAAAERYLARFPRGFAVEDARRIASGR